MRLGDDYRKCVVFFGNRITGLEDDLDPWGTGFLVATKDTGTVYMVTARHVVQDKLDCPFVIRFNDRNGGSKNWDVDFADWQFHPTDETVDVAALEVVPPAWADCRPLSQRAVIDEFKFGSKDIGAGDLVYTVGLWPFLPGKKRNKPFVHVGHIGMVPEEDRLVIKDWMPGRIGKDVEVEAYLTEGEPLRGASGSPVFVKRTLSLGRGLYSRDRNAETWVGGSVWLLGLMSAAFFERASFENLGDKYIPRGVNIVVPSMKINEVLDQKVLKEKRGSVRGDAQKY